MSLIPEISNPYLGAFAGGLLYGLAVCTASCLPVVTGYIAGIGAGFSKGVKVTLIFNSGRILAYTLIGALIGLFGGLFRVFVSELQLLLVQLFCLEQESRVIVTAKETQRVLFGRLVSLEWILALSLWG
jgi:sulfite exporter TauE/SafE